MTRAACIAKVAVVAVLALPGFTAADYPPGPLSRAHEKLEGVTGCTACHVPRAPGAGERCLSCHDEIASRIRDGRGWHARIRPAERTCGRCHLEHKGRDFPLVDWGPRGREGFDHARSGWPLLGKHASAACDRCHARGAVADVAIRKMLADQPSRRTYLGAPTACASCHADVHRGQLSKDCGSCHGNGAWKPAERFTHAKTSYPLTGAHATVACAKCHPREAASPPPLGSTPREAFPTPPAPGAPFVSSNPPAPGAAAVRYRPIAHEKCDDCHRDPHVTRFAEACSTCHTVVSWSDRANEFARQHDRTRYPLTGAHRKVACGACHGPHGAEKARLVNLPFGSCSDCHPDGHGGQVSGPKPPDCSRCHDVAGFLPARFEVEDHAHTRYPLEGAHRALACRACHPVDDALLRIAVSEARRALAGQGREVRVSAARLRYEADPGRCETCHRDPHRAQFTHALSRDGCAGCHTVRSFRESRFDHASTRFPLEGKHRDAPCASCHVPEASSSRDGAGFRRAPTACGACHADAHAGQFRTPAADRRACDRCHDAASWKAVKFVHEPPFTEYRLRGKHAAVKCDRCHPRVKVGPKLEIARYRPLPTRCDGCHDDPHRGAFKGFAP